MKTDPILKKFGKKTVCQKTMLEGSKDHYQKLNEIETLKNDFVNALAHVPHELMSALDKYSSKDLQDLSYTDRIDYFLHSLVCMFNSYISFMMKGERILLLAPETRNSLIRRNAFLHALLLFGIRYQWEDDTVTLPNMVRVPVSHYMNLFKNPTQIGSTAKWLDLVYKSNQKLFSIISFW